MEKIGLIGSILLATCGIPEAYRSYKNRDCSIGWLMLITWGLGEIFTLGYIVYKLGFLDPLLINYSINILVIGVMIYYKQKGNK